MKKTIITCLSLLFFVSLCAQNPILLQKRSKPGRSRELAQDRYYTILTTDGSYSGPIIACNDSVLKVTRRVKTDSVMRIVERIGAAKQDTIYEGKWTTDTLSLAYKNILCLKNPWFNKRGWIVPFVYMSGLGVLALVFVPVAAIAEGPDSAKEAAVGVGSMIGIGFSALFLGTRQRSFEIQDKWAFAGAAGQH